MKTIADFKRKMVVGAEVNTLLYWGDKAGNFQLQRDYGTRKVTVHQSNSFALETEKPDGTKINSWCDWPKKGQFNPIGENKAEIIFESGKLVYEIIN